MKNVISVLFLLATVNAFACQPSAQFIGTITSIYSNQDSCNIVINAQDVEQFNPSYVCPLFPGEAIGTPITITNNKEYYCSLSEGDFVSGVLVKTESGLVTIE